MASFRFYSLFWTLLSLAAGIQRMSRSLPKWALLHRFSHRYSLFQRRLSGPASNSPIQRALAMLARYHRKKRYAVFFLCIRFSAVYFLFLMCQKETWLGIPKSYLTPVNVGLTVTLSGALTTYLTFAVVASFASSSNIGRSRLP